uniref:Uncharacterized protein n=1 Tax=Timema cristinae TaxID=61476 RepID=A0A7R9D299_TIMCR|nr:unnamed protein product [Timema cristinae]
MNPPLSTPDRDSNHDLPIDDTPFQLVLGPAQFVRYSLDESLGGALYGTAALRHRRRWSSATTMSPGVGVSHHNEPRVGVSHHNEPPCWCQPPQ